MALRGETSGRGPRPEVSPRRAKTLSSPCSRRTVLRGLAAAALLPLTGCFGDDWDSFPDTTLTLATGNAGGVFARYGDALGAVLASRLGVEVEISQTDASVENLRLVADARADIAMTLGDTAADAIRGRGVYDEPLDVVAVARTYDSFVHLVVRAESPIQTVADLRGKRVGVGRHDSGTRLVAVRILRENAVPLDAVQISTRHLQDDAEALVDDRLDAFFFVSGLPNEAIATLSERIPIRLIGLEKTVEAMIRSYESEYVAGPIPASTYRLTTATETVSVKNYIVADPAMPDDLAYAVTRVMFEAQDAIDARAAGVGQPNLAAGIFTSPLDLHPGALRYFREQRPDV
ncbi:TAXI family TRAP transporter solute-binding subunit [Solicola gregarius]|uniref:TAXI family TRAP transporter solute-binding subunit n=1 Tax=Solicola gregarius TaxID=2908642 RepID=A0AA46TEP4_9ACTN|nr:TAXI family TRAP transporter solute-binding subunit [Solicola gregarius]UYM03961.1 TAXI family TRAP transporter solute-binding subunit [Solicola gregarius]